MDPATLDKLLKAQPALWRGRDRYTSAASIPTGFTVLDNALPAQGWSIGGVTELLVEQHGIGELSLLLPALSQVAGQGWAALINPPHIPYAPAFSNAGIALDRLLIVNTGNDIDTLWSTEQVLRSGLFGAVVAWVQKSSAQRQRRLQLAAEAGDSLAVVYRPLQACKEHSPVATRICITLQKSPSANSAEKQATTRSTGAQGTTLHDATTPDNTVPDTHPQQQLTLDIIKLRAGNPQIVTINPEEFDASQGSEWPVLKPEPVSSGVTTPIALRSLSGIRRTNTHPEQPARPNNKPACSQKPETRPADNRTGTAGL